MRTRHQVFSPASTFVPDPMWRALGLAAGCFVVLLSHAYLRPYADRYYGWAETLFLCDLTLVAVLQIPQATFAALGQPFEGTAAEAVSDLQEALALLPLAFCAYVLLRRYGLPLVHRLWSKSCGPREDAHDHPGKEDRGHLHRQATRTEEHTTLLSSTDGTEQQEEDGEGEDVALVSHRNNGERHNEEGPSLAQLVERQEGRFSPYLQRPSL